MRRSLGASALLVMDSLNRTGWCDGDMCSSCYFSVSNNDRIGPSCVEYLASSGDHTAYTLKKLLVKHLISEKLKLI